MSKYYRELAIATPHIETGASRRYPNGPSGDWPGSSAAVCKKFAVHKRFYSISTRDQLHHSPDIQSLIPLFTLTPVFSSEPRLPDQRVTTSHLCPPTSFSDLPRLEKPNGLCKHLNYF